MKFTMTAGAVKLFLLSSFTLVAAARGDFCCSYNFVDCDADPDSWCHGSAMSCAKCQGFYIDADNPPVCTPRWSVCTADGECCGAGTFTTCQEGTSESGNVISTCQLKPDLQLTLPPTASPTRAPRDEHGRRTKDCCSFDFKNCDDSWCGESPNNCRDCDGFWINPSKHAHPKCTPRWTYCESTAACCGETLICRTIFNDDGSSYPGCELPLDFERANWKPPADAVVEDDDDAEAPPTPAPTQEMVDPDPNDEFAGYPKIPYITHELSSQLVTIPLPPRPTELLLGDDRTNCPHNQQDGGLLLDWHDAATWGDGNGIPAAGQDVTLPANSKVVIRKTVQEKLAVITIPETSELIFGEHSDGINLHVNGILVLGKLTAGSETCRLETIANGQSAVTITLHGSRPANAVTDVPDEVVKGIDVMGGVLELHGQRFFPTWSRLAKPIWKGEKVIMLQDQVNWQPGQEIVLVTTSMKDSREWHQNEVHVIRAIHPNPPANVGTVVYLEEAATYDHLANTGYQAEVGLLSRAIKVQGSETDSEPTDADPLTCTTERNLFGDNGAPCPFTSLTGYGGHVIIRGNNAQGHVEGVELYRMGQTNVMARYPMHFHLLGDKCPTCYFRESSVHRSYYRCVAVHSTNQVTVSENVGYDVTGYCYYLEDGVEQENYITYNLAAHIHSIGPEAPWGVGQFTEIYTESDQLTQPADVTASGFYISNVHNYIVGNAASGGWAGYAFPNLPVPLATNRNSGVRPLMVTMLEFDGNTAHSTGWWWFHAAGFYFGSTLYYNSDDKLEYNPGRSNVILSDDRDTCNVVPTNGATCPEKSKAWIRLTNSKVFLISGPGMGSWSGRLEIVGYEAHDVGLSIETLSEGSWFDTMLIVCRSGEDLHLPPAATARQVPGNGFRWYDAKQEHIMTNTTFRNCGYRLPKYDLYDKSETRGCGNDVKSGCDSGSAVYGFVSHSDEFVPEVMQASSDITYDNCGRRFYIYDFRGPSAPETISERIQNWLDADGSGSGLNVPTLIGSGVEGAKDWWHVDDKVVYDPQGPLRFIKVEDGPQRNLGHIRVKWDDALHDQVGTTVCGNGDDVTTPCPTVGYIRHLGHRFSPAVSQIGPGLPVTANAHIVGPTGGYGWLLSIDQGSPRNITFNQVEASPDSPILVTIPYPPGTSFDIRAHAASWCFADGSYTCVEEYRSVDSVEQVRNGQGNEYHVDSVTGALTLRILSTPMDFTGHPQWSLPGYEDVGRDTEYALTRFERKGLRLPKLNYLSRITVLADCEGSGAYCTKTPGAHDPDVCPDGYVQVSYDQCCSNDDPSNCVFAPGSSKPVGRPAPPTSDVVNGIGPCCSLDFKSCDTSWCGACTGNCIDCDGFWIRPQDYEPTCTKRFSPCVASEECCGDSMICREVVDEAGKQYFGCDLPAGFNYGKETAVQAGTLEDGRDHPECGRHGEEAPVNGEGPCCSFNFKECDTSWCNKCSNNCLECDGFWVRPQDFEPSCKERYSFCTSNDDCCGDTMVCRDIVNEGGDSYSGCDVPVDFDYSEETAVTKQLEYYGDCPVEEPVPFEKPEGICRAVNTQGFEDGCCSFNFQSCDNSWCSVCAENCAECKGWWIRPDDVKDCKSRWSFCTGDDDCCSDELVCREIVDDDGNSYTGCALPEDYVFVDPYEGNKPGPPAEPVLENGVGPCCSFDFKSCDDSWCNKCTDNCIDCDGFWIRPQDYEPKCTKRYSHCSTEEDCCGDSMVCRGLVGPDGGQYLGCDLPLGFPYSSETAIQVFGENEYYGNCGVEEEKEVDLGDGLCRAEFTQGVEGGCCSYNFKTCDNSWCGICSENCAECDGWWISPEVQNADCKARWSFCENDDQCCGDDFMVCRDLVDGDGNSYSGCDLPPPDHQYRLELDQFIVELALDGDLNEEKLVAAFEAYIANRMTSAFGNFLRLNLFTLPPPTGRRRRLQTNAVTTYLWGEVFFTGSKPELFRVRNEQLLALKDSTKVQEVVSDSEIGMNIILQNIEVLNTPATTKGDSSSSSTVLDPFSSTSTAADLPARERFTVATLMAAFASGCLLLLL